MSLSSNSVIHFTNTKDKLKGILESNFKIYFCRESIELDDTTVAVHVPMVSFCDIPLSEVKNHINKYGAYGIGLTKEWAQRQGLNPVIYIDVGSKLANSFDIIIEKYIVEAVDTKAANFNESETCVIDVIRYIKNYQGDLSRGGNLIKDYRYSDEREWRYVPSKDAGCELILSSHFYDNEGNNEVLEKCCARLAQLELVFEPNDIKYIIIENDSEIPEFMDLLRKTKGKTYTYHDIERLMTRILTTEQIVSDI